jgi:hypothetical protein
MDYYTYKGRGACDVSEECLLSPKGLVVEKGKHQYFVTCESCRNCLKDKNMVPERAICNKLEVGAAPIELTCLIDVELAFISPVRCHSHIMLFKGGHKGMQGFHSFLKTNVTRLRWMLEHMGSLEGMPNRVIVVLHGLTFSSLYLHLMMIRS